MPKPRKARLDALERRLTSPKKIALFGHRAVGKTTLLAMFYRQAADRAGPRASAWRRRTRGAPNTWPRRSPRSNRASRPRGRWPRPSWQAPALSRPGPVRPDRQGLPGRACHPGDRRADPGVLRRLRRRPPLPRPRPRSPGRPTGRASAAGGRAPPGTLHRTIRRRHRRSARGAARHQVSTASPAGARPAAARIRSRNWSPSGYGMTLHALESHVPRGAPSSRSAPTAAGPTARTGRRRNCTRSASKGLSSGSPSSGSRSTDEAQLEWLWDLAPDDLSPPGPLRPGLRLALSAIRATSSTSAEALTKLRNRRKGSEGGLPIGSRRRR